MEPGGEAETHADLVDASDDPPGTEVGHHAQRAEDEARPPCLHTLVPVAATTRAAMVDTLMLRSRSPPVPQVSMTSMPEGRSSGTAWATMARTNPVISSTDSPLARSAVAMAAI
jgi:hypothetical protein